MAEKLVKFVSKYPSLKITLKSPGKTIIDGKVVVTPGEYAEFKDGQYSTSDSRIIDKIKAGSLFGNKVFIDVPDKLVDKKIKIAQEAIKKAAQEEKTRPEEVVVKKRGRSKKA